MSDEPTQMELDEMILRAKRKILADEAEARTSLGAAILKALAEKQRKKDG